MRKKQHLLKICSLQYPQNSPLNINVQAPRELRLSYSDRSLLQDIARNTSNSCNMLTLIEGHFSNVANQNAEIIALLRILTQQPIQQAAVNVTPRTAQVRRNKRTDAVSLVTPQTVLNDPTWLDKKWVGKPGDLVNALTIALAQRSFFGDSYMKCRCVTTEFNGNSPLTFGSDKQKLDEIKILVKNQVASHQSIPEFEISWKNALKSLQKHITHVRAYQIKNSTSFCEHSFASPSTSARENNAND